MQPLWKRLPQLVFGLFFLAVLLVLLSFNHHLPPASAEKLPAAGQPVYLPFIAKTQATPATSNGLLRKNPANGRYFTDGTGKAILLVGSHTWSNFIDSGDTNPPPVFNFTAYLDWLQSYNHNFIRLWRAENAKGGETSSEYWFFPMPYPRPGPGTAWDGQPKFNLGTPQNPSFNQSYFDRMRSRVIAAGQRGIYVSIMLFDGWSVERKGDITHQPWPGHPFNSQNNSNGINGDTNNDGQGGEVHTEVNSTVLALQQAYVRKVIDTVNDLDNVLYEISNEDTGSTANTTWQYNMINYIKSYEAGKSKQHPVGMTAQYPNQSNSVLFASPADWIAPTGLNTDPAHVNDNWKIMLVGDGSKVILNDTDHLCGVCDTDETWVWRSLTNGLNPIFMDKYDGVDKGRGSFPYGDDRYNPKDVLIRQNMGYALNYAKRMNLNAMTPRGDGVNSFILASTTEYLVYLPNGGSTSVNLSATLGTLQIEWFNPSTGVAQSGGTITGGTTRSFTAPFSGDAVLYLH